MMKHRDPLLYGIIGALIGGVITWVLATTVVNTNRFGIMPMMGRQTQTTSYNNGSGMMVNNIDSHFIEQMIPHHKDAIKMADIALQKAEHQEVKTLAASIKKTQSEEITQMQNWHKAWYGLAAPTDTDDTDDRRGMMGGMRGSMMNGKRDLKRLENATNFDQVFIEEMIPHHQMAIMMADMLLQGTTRPEMKQLAQSISTSQSNEIKQMEQWYTNWDYDK